MEEVKCKNCGTIITPINKYKYYQKLYECPKCKALWTFGVDVWGDEYVDLENIYCWAT